MNDLTNAIKSTISISDLNRGLAGKVFESVKSFGPKVVMKNNVAECVLISPEEYLELMDFVNEAKLLKIAVQRLSSNDDKNTISKSNMMEKLGISQEDIDNFEDIELE